MSVASQKYPAFDTAKADLLVCPLSGKPILRAKPGAEGEAYLKEQDLQPAIEKQFPGTADKVWIAPEKPAPF